MPMFANDNSLTIALGEGDVGIGLVKEPGYTGCGFVLLSKPYEKGEDLSAEDPADKFKVYLLLRDERGISDLERILMHCKTALGLHASLGEKVGIELLDEIGILKRRIKELEGDREPENG